MMGKKKKRDRCLCSAIW